MNEKRRWGLRVSSEPDTKPIQAGKAWQANTYERVRPQRESKPESERTTSTMASRPGQEWKPKQHKLDSNQTKAKSASQRNTTRLESDQGKECKPKKHELDPKQTKAKCASQINTTRLESEQENGRAHIRTPVRCLPRMPLSALTDNVIPP